MFSFCRLLFGLNESGNVYSYLTSKLLNSLQDASVFSYVDNTTLGSSDTTQHLKLLRRYFLCVRDAGVKINYLKSKILVDQVELVGYLIKQGRIYVTEQRRQAILDLQYPVTVKQLRRVLGMFVFVKNHVKI